MRSLKIELVVACVLAGLLGFDAKWSAGDELGASPSNTEWHTDLSEAVAESKRTGKPVLMEINGRPWCPTCNAQGEKVIAHPKFQDWAIENVVLLDMKVGEDYDRDKGNPIWFEQMEQHRLSSIPAAVMLDQHGETMGIVYPKDDVLQWIGAANNIITSHARTADAQMNSALVIPFRLTKWNNISVPVTLNDSIALNLMFHTAVDSVSLTRATTERFPEINLDQDTDVNSWGGQSKSRFGMGHSLKVGPLTPQQVTVFEDLHSGHDTDGKFGPDQLLSKLLAIDFDRSEIRLLSELPGDVSEWQKHSFEIERGMMFITAAVQDGDNRANHKFMIHSGYSGFALLDDEFSAKHPFLESLEVIAKSELTDSAGHKLETIKVRLPRFTVGETVFEDAPVSFFSGTIGRQPFSVLGGDFLKRFNLIFDLDNHDLYMKKSELSGVEYFQNE